MLGVPKKKKKLLKSYWTFVVGSAFCFIRRIFNYDASRTPKRSWLFFLLLLKIPRLIFINFYDFFQKILIFIISISWEFTKSTFFYCVHTILIHGVLISFNVNNLQICLMARSRFRPSGFHFYGISLLNVWGNGIVTFFGHSF